MIYLVTNRNINDRVTDYNMFGDNFNTEGSEVLRVAKASYNGSWKLKLFPEDTTKETTEPTEQIFSEAAINDEEKPCVVFIHGFNQSLEKNLEKCKQIESYGVNVIAFSWPSNPGPQFILAKIAEYRRAQKNARRSIFALERFLDKLVNFVEKNGGPKQIKTLFIHSLGNYLLQSFVQSPGFENQTSMFKNIVLHQADVDSKNHEQWTDKLGMSSRVIVTINETDDTLDFSDVINPDRLGNTAANLNCASARYYNFTNTEAARDSHRLWEGPAEKSDNIYKFFNRTFTGKNIGQQGMTFNSGINCFEIT